MKEPKFLTQANKDLLTANGIDWQSILQKAANFAQILLTLISLLGGKLPQPAQGTSPAQCDHHTCCCECLEAAVNTVSVCAKHCGECCDLYC